MKNTTNNEKNINPINIIDNNGLLSDLGKFSDNINKNTIIDNITVIENDILSPESHGTIKLIIINVAVANVGIIIFKL